ncbi:hypothetical protein POM88_038540 [Heracleum sosnowskyi]|uniref:Uncharacterized protein n=1 Tax=Heracleum sosnowskyi TaxID=360622 RepID=A0AAD8H9G8_9APIA|nr:hypothetical protein POM88_038540 [Heracleum sosnowskyi]
MPPGQKKLWEGPLRKSPRSSSMPEIRDWWSQSKANQWPQFTYAQRKKMILLEPLKQFLQQATVHLQTQRKNVCTNDSTGAADTVHCIRSQSTCKLNARLEPDTETCGIKDTFRTTSLTLSNKEVKQLTGVPLHKILTEMEENEVRTQIRAAIKNIIRRVYAFRFKVTSYN